MNEKESLIQQLQELKALRDRLTSVDNVEELNENSADIREYLKDELDLIDKELREIEEESKETARQYEESSREMQNLIDENTKKMEDTKLLSEDEIIDARYKAEQQKLEINEKSSEILKRFNEQQRIIRNLRRKKSEINNNIKKSEALGLSYNDYKDITSTIRKTSIMNAILEAKGLMPIIEKPSNERTKEEKELLKNTKEEILTEISEFKKEYDDYSVLDIIEALYSLETTYKKVEAPKVTEVKESQLVALTRNVQILPYKVVDSNMKNISIIQEGTPKDMVGATPNEKVDINELKPAEEKVTLFKDADSNEYYVRKYTVDRFKLKSADLGNEVKIDGSLCYKISEYDVNRIKENANNAFSPYIADIKEISLNPIKDNNEISPEDTKDELIPGTDIKRPRDRKVNETDEEYEKFLKNYYDKVFPQEETKEDDKNEKITIFKEEDKYYVRKYAVDRFKLKSATNEVRIDGSLCCEISKDDVDKIVDNRDNGFSPYRVEVKDTIIDKELTKEEITEVINEEMKKEDTKEELTDEAITEVIDEEIEKGKVEEKPKDKLKATNVKASREFKEELKSGNILYNIIHKAPKVILRAIERVEEFFAQAEDFINPSVAGTKMYTDDLPRYLGR